MGGRGGGQKVRYVLRSPRETKLFGGISRGFARISRGVPENFEKKKVCVQVLAPKLKSPHRPVFAPPWSEASPRPALRCVLPYGVCLFSRGSRLNKAHTILDKKTAVLIYSKHVFRHLRGNHCRFWAPNFQNFSDIILHYNAGKAFSLVSSPALLAKHHSNQTSAGINFAKLQQSCRSQM